MKKHTKEKYDSVTAVTNAQHVRIVKDIFKKITKRYDFLNHLFSLGQDIHWRRFTTEKMRFFKTFRYLDVATGTGDLAIETVLRYPHVSATGLDFVQEMMDRGKRKVNRRRLSERIAFSRGNALNLPFPDDHFDIAGIAFGIRNIPNRWRAIEEMKRVVVPGGQVMVLEMNFPRSRSLQRIYRIYINNILPWTSRYFSGYPAAYAYLADSIIHFPSPDNFVQIMKDTGLTDIHYYPLTMGITHLYIGIKP
ncbi:MAG: ubiquinone/menaquinone biosynthesis methyltransferase [Deltaproteobacteria bacterium]|nr:ubiquinone/menaquinone biosynthesis methyltransferase [Deltaproteobacteria bacterium]